MINVVLVISLLYIRSGGIRSSSDHATETKTVWHGGNPMEEKTGSCWCGEDKYCMCTPNLAIDLIIASGEIDSEGSTVVDSFWLVRRKDTGQLATMGGFVDVDETVEDAVKRELKEEMDLTLSSTPTLVGIYSDPRRDHRRRTASAVFAVQIQGEIRPNAGDDAKDVVKIPVNDVEKHSFFADHRTILLDYRSSLRKEKRVEQHELEGDFAGGVARSTCGA